MKTKICCIIPARSGSKGIPGKNTRPVAGHPLLAYSIAAAQSIAMADKIIVSTNSQETAEIVRKYGVEVPFLRPEAAATDKASDRDYLVHALEWLEKNENYRPDAVVLLRPTTPERDPELLNRAMDQFLSSKADSLRSVHPCAESPFKWFRKDEQGYAKPIADFLTLEDTNRPRQSFESVYLPNGYVDILRPEIVLNSANVYGEKILCFETEPVIELDTMHDFETLVASASAPSSKLQKLMAEKTEFKSSVRGRHIGLVVKDLNRMLNFYREVLGLKVVSHEMEQGSYLDSVLSIPDVRINIAKLVDSSNWMLELLCFPERDAEQRKVLPDTPGYTHVALTVSNAEQMYQRFLDLGLKPLSSPQKNKTGTVKLFFCRDPEGNLMELVQILQT